MISAPIAAAYNSVNSKAQNFDPKPTRSPMLKTIDATPKVIVIIEASGENIFRLDTARAHNAITIRRSDKAWECIIGAGFLCVCTFYSTVTDRVFVRKTSVPRFNVMEP